MELKATFKDCIIYIHAEGEGTGLLVRIPKEANEHINGVYISDEFEYPPKDQGVPEEEGFYLVDIESWYQEGWFEGYPDAREDEWFLKMANVREMTLVPKPPSYEHDPMARYEDEMK